MSIYGLLSVIQEMGINLNYLGFNTTIFLLWSGLIDTFQRLSDQDCIVLKLRFCTDFTTIRLQLVFKILANVYNNEIGYSND